MNKETLNHFKLVCTEFPNLNLTKSPLSVPKGFLFISKLLHLQAPSLLLTELLVTKAELCVSGFQIQLLTARERHQIHTCILPVTITSLKFHGKKDYTHSEDGYTQLTTMTFCNIQTTNTSGVQKQKLQLLKTSQNFKELQDFGPIC